MYKLLVFLTKILTSFYSSALNFTALLSGASYNFSLLLDFVEFNLIVLLGHR